MLQETMGSHSVSLAKSSGNRDRPNGKRLRNTPDDPDADLRKRLRDWAKADQQKSSGERGRICVPPAG
ncbi:hypothetical protein JCM9803A_03040 [Rhodococcus erythropolis]